MMEDLAHPIWSNEAEQPIRPRSASCQGNEWKRPTLSKACSGCWGMTVYAVDYNRARIQSGLDDWNKLFERIGQRYETLYGKVPAGTRKLDIGGEGPMTEPTFDYEIVDNPKPGITSKATVTLVETTKAGEIFKEKAKDPEQDVCVIYGKVEHDGWEGRLRTFSKPSTKQISTRTKMAQFKLRYKQFPRSGMKVDVITDANGYWKMIP